jgi:hypothetical protein
VIRAWASTGRGGLSRPPLRGSTAAVEELIGGTLKGWFLTQTMVKRHPCLLQFTLNLSDGLIVTSDGSDMRDFSGNSGRT